MSIKTKRFFNFLKKEEVRCCWAFLFYMSFVIIFSEMQLPKILNIAIAIVQLICILFASFYLCEFMDKKYEIRKELKKIGIEVLKYIPIFVIKAIVSLFILTGSTENQKSLDEGFLQNPISMFILMVFFGPILEEFIFRFLPSIFIKNNMRIL